MISPNYPPSDLANTLDKLVKAASEEKTSFRALATAAGFDPSRDFIGAFLPNIDFRDEDLRGFNFTNADLTGSDFRRANVRGASFDGAVLAGVIGLPESLDEQGEMISPTSFSFLTLMHGTLFPSSADDERPEFNLTQFKPILVCIFQLVKAAGCTRTTVSAHQGITFRPYFPLRYNIISYDEVEQPEPHRTTKREMPGLWQRLFGILREGRKAKTAPRIAPPGSVVLKENSSELRAIYAEMQENFDHVWTTDARGLLDRIAMVLGSSVRASRDEYGPHLEFKFKDLSRGASIPRAELNALVGEAASHETLLSNHRRQVEVRGSTKNIVIDKNS